MSPNGKVAPASTPDKNEQLDSYPQTRAALREVRSPPKKLQQHNGTKNLRITTRKGKEKLFPFACIIPSSRLVLMNTRGNSPTRKSSPPPEKGEQSEWRALPAFRNHFGFYSMQRLTKLRHIELARNKDEGQELPISAMGRSDHGS